MDSKVEISSMSSHTSLCLFFSSDHVGQKVITMFDNSRSKGMLDNFLEGDTSSPSGSLDSLI